MPDPNRPQGVSPVAAAACIHNGEPPIRPLDAKRAVHRLLNQIIFTMWWQIKAHCTPPANEDAIGFRQCKRKAGLFKNTQHRPHLGEAYQNQSTRQSRLRHFPVRGRETAPLDGLSSGPSDQSHRLSVSLSRPILSQTAMHVCGHLQSEGAAPSHGSHP